LSIYSPQGEKVDRKHEILNHFKQALYHGGRKELVHYILIVKNTICLIFLIFMVSFEGFFLQTIELLDL
jgi:hypothetical protein